MKVFPPIHRYICDAVPSIGRQVFDQIRKSTTTTTINLNNFNRRTGKKKKKKLFVFSSLRERGKKIIEINVTCARGDCESFDCVRAFTWNIHLFFHRFSCWCDNFYWRTRIRLRRSTKTRKNGEFQKFQTNFEQNSEENLFFFYFDWKSEFQFLAIFYFPIFRPRAILSMRFFLSPNDCELRQKKCNSLNKWNDSIFRIHHINSTAGVKNETNDNSNLSNLVNAFTLICVNGQRMNEFRFIQRTLPEQKKKIEIEKVILRIETFNLLHLKCHFDDQVAFRAQRRGSGGEWHQFIWWRINGWTQQSCRRIIANRRSKSRNHCKKSLWPTRPNPICKIVPFHLISWNYFVCNVVRTREPSR